MASDEGPRESAGSDGSLELTLERQHLHAALEQVDEVVRTAETDFESALLQINRTTVESVPGALYAGITMVDDGEVSTLAATHPYPTVLDDVQRATNQGPCLSAAWHQHVIRIDDLTEDMRWPRYREAALEQCTVRSVLSFQLFETNHRMAALNIYADTAGAFDDESVEMGFLFAANATVAWNATNRENQFRSALASRDVIGQAKGILMERFDVDAVRAFELLRKISQDSNTRLVAVAERLIASGRR